MFPRPPLLTGHPGDGRLTESNDELWNWWKMDENCWKWKKINDWKLVETNEELWNCEKMGDYCRKSLKIAANGWKLPEIDENFR